jgi:hypothetical protein
VPALVLGAELFDPPPMCGQGERGAAEREAACGFGVWLGAAAAPGMLAAIPPTASAELAMQALSLLRLIIGVDLLQQSPVYVNR